MFEKHVYPKSYVLASSLWITLWGNSEQAFSWFYSCLFIFPWKVSFEQMWSSLQGKILPSLSLTLISYKLTCLVDSNTKASLALIPTSQCLFFSHLQSAVSFLCGFPAFILSSLQWALLQENFLAWQPASLSDLMSQDSLACILFQPYQT